MGNRLYVGNLSYTVTEAELREVFAEGGKNVVEVKIVLDRDTGRPRGFAFVEMGSEQEATQAITTLSGREIQGRPISVVRHANAEHAAAVAVADSAAVAAMTAMIRDAGADAAAAGSSTGSILRFTDGRRSGRGCVGPALPVLKYASTFRSGSRPSLPPARLVARHSKVDLKQ